MQVAVEGTSYYTSFKMQVRLSEFQVVGKLRFRASPNLSTIVLSFLQPPRFRFKTECSAVASSWGVPLPLHSSIEAVVYEEARNWLSRNVVEPNEYTLKPTNFQPKGGLSDEDLKKAIRAATVAQSIAVAQEEG